MSVYRTVLIIIIFNPAGVKGLARDNHVHLVEIISAPPSEGLLPSIHWLAHRSRLGVECYVIETYNTIQFGVAAAACAIMQHHFKSSNNGTF